jgi:putative SOS response-associated peptidase YedK
MCGRYVQVSKLEVLEKRFEAVVSQPELWRPNANVAPGARAPVVTGDEPKVIQFYQFGFRPSWGTSSMMFLNARSEGDQNPENDPRYAGAKGIIQKPSFRKAIRGQRCLVLADAFIEGPFDRKLSEPYLVYLKGKERPFAMAGIWDSWTDPATQRELFSFAIITTTANEVLQKIRHPRSPVIIPRDAEAAWLSSETPLSDVTDMLRSWPSESMNAYPISPAIKHPAAQGLDLLNPIGQRIMPEDELSLRDSIELQGAKPR